jgi:exonuclease SbcC
LASLAEVSPAAASRLGPGPSLPELATLLEKSDADLKASRSAAAEADRLRGRLERRTAAQKALEQAEARAAEAASQMDALRSKVVGLGFDQVTLDKARAALSNAEAAAAQAASVATSSRQAAIRARAGADAEAKRLAEARSQHSQLADLANQSVHLARAAELLNAFRNDVVATVGPRLAVQAADLFSELTDNDYDRLEVDPETYGLKISDAGLSYGLERFSGSEVDLANLALRVAISEHVRLLSGGTVGLLVLDEVFGPLDEERKARMLQALERLRARFRQILVVTHSPDIKDQLPHAIEVVKRPGRRATARVVVM